MERSRRLPTICAALVLSTVAYCAGRVEGAAPPRALPATGIARPIAGGETVLPNVGGSSIFLTPIAVSRPTAISAGTNAGGSTVAVPMHRRRLPSTGATSDKGATDKNAAPPRPIYKNIPVHRLPMGW